MIFMSTASLKPYTRTQQSDFEFSVSYIMYELGGKTTYGTI